MILPWDMLEYERLAGFYLRDDMMEKAVEIHYEIIWFENIRNSSYFAMDRELSFVRAIFALLPNEDAPLGDNFFSHSDYVARLLVVRTTDDWFKSLLTMLHGMAQYLKREVADVSSLLEHAYQRMTKNECLLQKNRPAYFYFFLGQISRFLGHVHFQSNREEEAIAKMLEASRYDRLVFIADVGFKDMGAYAEICSDLLRFLASPQDELALIGTSDGFSSRTSHGINDETSWVVDVYNDVLNQAYYYENGAEELWRSRAAVLESLRIDHTQFCPVRRSIFDQFYCPV